MFLLMYLNPKLMMTLKRVCVLLLLLATVLYVIDPVLRLTAVVKLHFPAERVYGEPRPDSSGGEQIRVIVLAYMRTGSSMTGSLLDVHPDVFYWYEPLHTLGRDYSRLHPHLNKWRRRHLFTSSDEATGNVSALLRCDISSVYWQGLTDGFMKLGRATRPFTSCFHDGLGHFLLKDSTFQWDQCLDRITAACRRDHRVVALKTIRLRMSRALELMRSDPSLRVLHLVRDPRGILRSRQRLGYANFSELNVEARQLCSRMSGDLDAAQSVLTEENLKRRYMLVRYEDVATAPRAMTEKFYQFLGLETSEQGLRHASAVARSAPKRRRLCVTCKPESSNSSARSQQWRRDTLMQHVHVITSECSDLLELLGYRVLFKDAAELLDLRVETVVDPVLHVASSFVHNTDERDSWT